MRKDIWRIFNAFGGKLVGTRQMQRYVCETVTFFPPAIIAHVTTMCWFLGSMDNAWAFTFTGNDLKDQHLIFLSDELLSQHPPQVYYSIAHEIGHVMLGHRNSVLEKQSKQEIREQEKQADEFAKRYLIKGTF